MTPRRALLSATVALAYGGPAVTVQARTLEQVIDRKALTVCAASDAKPFSSKTDEAAPGIQIELARAVARELGVGLDVEWILLRRDARRAGCDAVMGSIASDTEGKSAKGGGNVKLRRLAVTRPYARLTSRIVVPDGAKPITQLSDLKGRVVAVPHASLTHYVLSKHDVPVRTLYPSAREILDAVASHKVDAGIVNDWEFGWYGKTHPSAHLQEVDKLVVDPDLDVDVGVTLLNTDTAMVDRVNGILASLAASGELRKIFGKYGIPYKAPVAR